MIYIKRIKIIQVVGSMNLGGIEAFLMNILRNIDRSRFEMLFLCYSDEEYAYEKEINTLGSRIIHISSPKKVGYFKHLKELINVFEKEKPDVVHAHNEFNAGFSMYAAKKCCIKKRFSHAHTTITNRKKSVVRFVYEYFMKKSIIKNTTMRFACSLESGKHFYGKNTFTVIPNVVDISKFQFSSNLRKKYRERYNLMENSVVIGHVGSFYPVKNQKFLIEVLNQIVNNHHLNYFHLFFVGTGDEMDSCKKLSLKYNLNDNIHFPGATNEVSEILNIFDCFAFPSLYEGIPLSLIEAQSNGLLAYVSDCVDPSVNFGNCIFLTIEDIQTWVEIFIHKDFKRDNLALEKLLKSEFNLVNSMQKICSYYEG